MSKFKVGDKVVWKDKRYAKDWFRHTVDSVMTVVGHKIYEDNETNLLITDNGVEAYGFRFELYKEKEMQEFDKNLFDLKKNPWYIRVENEEQFNLANEWLKDNFGNSLMVTYWKDVVGITNVDGYGSICDRPMWLAERHTQENIFRHEIKLNFKTVISSVEYPAIETEQQKRIRELKETIDNVNKQFEELMKEAK